MVHIEYFIDDICLPPADLTGTCHGISFFGFTVINITPTVSSNVFFFFFFFFFSFFLLYVPCQQLWSLRDGQFT